MTAWIRAALPDARLEGFELQEHLTDQVEAMAGFVTAPPFGALLTIGTGGTMVELQSSRSPTMPSSSGYRNLIPHTPTGLAPPTCTTSPSATPGPRPQGHSSMPMVATAT